MKKLRRCIYGAGMEYNRLNKNQIEIIGIVITRIQNFSYIDSMCCFIMDRIFGRYSCEIIHVEKRLEVLYKEYEVSENDKI